MKAFLMHRDRDFDPRQILARRDKELRRGRGNDKGIELESLLPWNQEALRQDLGVDVLFNAMARGDLFLLEVAAAAVLSSLTDADAIRYRQHVYRDCQNNEQIVRQMYRIAVEAVDHERKNYWSLIGRYPSGVLHRAVDVLSMFVGALRALRKIADQHAEHFKSEGFTTLLAMLRDKLGDDYFAEIDRHLANLKSHRGTLISAGLGKGNKGDRYVLRKPVADKRSWLARLTAEKPPAYSFKLHPRDEAGARALGELNDRGVNLVANALAQSTDHILGFFQMLRTELAFYVGCLNLNAVLAGMGEPVCMPLVAPPGERKLSFFDLHDVALALSRQQAVIGNDLDADRKDIAIVTGANTGGKSTFLRSVGLAHLMMQAGMFVCAKSFAGEACNGIFTHYRREEDAAMESGKWDEELSRMSGILDKIRPHSLLLFNESFASTNEREGSEIASQVVRALVDRGVKVFFVTHLYHFASGFAAAKADNVVFLRAQRNPDGTRPFKLIEAPPLQTSYGPDLYRAIFGEADERQRHSSGGDNAAAGLSWAGGRATSHRDGR